jgi:hypothetical protein
MAILVLLNGVSMFVTMYPVRWISSEVLKSCLLETFFPELRVPQSIVSENEAVFK